MSTWPPKVAATISPDVTSALSVLVRGAPSNLKMTGVTIAWDAGTEFELGSIGRLPFGVVHWGRNNPDNRTMLTSNRPGAKVERVDLSRNSTASAVGTNG